MVLLNQCSRQMVNTCDTVWSFLTHGAKLMTPWTLLKVYDFSKHAREPVVIKTQHSALLDTNCFDFLTLLVPLNINTCISHFNQSTYIVNPFDWNWHLWDFSNNRNWQLLFGRLHKGFGLHVAVSHDVGRYEQWWRAIYIRLIESKIVSEFRSIGQADIFLQLPLQDSGTLCVVY